jgi:hypothetical protein
VHDGSSVVLSALPRQADVQFVAMERRYFRGNRALVRLERDQRAIEGADLAHSRSVAETVAMFDRQPPPCRSHRGGVSTLSFRVGRNRPMGSKSTGHVLKLRGNTTGDEVFAGAFGRRSVQQAFESQGWSFS